MSLEPISSIEQLVAAREARGLSVEDMVRQLKLAPRQLRALEEGDWQALPGLAFTRAVLRSYGRALGVDVDPLIASMSPAVPEADLKPASTLHQPMPSRSMLGFGSGGGGNRLAWILLIVLAVVALAMFFGGDGNLSHVRSWLAEFRSSTPQIPSPDAGDAPASGAPAAGRASSEPLTLPLTLPTAPTEGAAVTKPAPAESGVAPASKPSTSGSPASPVPAAPGAVSQAQPGASAPAGAVAPAAPAPGGATASAPAPASSDTKAQAGSDGGPRPAATVDGAKGGATEGRHVVKLVFKRDSWVEARGADGNVLITGTNKADTDRQFTATGPISMIIGNAEFVRLEVDGQPFDLVPHTRAAIARVTLP